MSPLERIERNQLVVLHALRHILERANTMSKIHDDIKAALADNGKNIADADNQSEKLKALHAEDQKAFASILDEIRSHGDAMAKVSQKLEGVLAGEAQAVKQAFAEVDPATLAHESETDGKAD